MDKIPEMIPISLFNRGKAGSIFDDVKKNDSIKVVVKNNEAEAVLISVKQYNEMAENSFYGKIRTYKKNHRAFGAARKYADPDIIGKEKELYARGVVEKYAGK